MIWLSLLMAAPVCATSQPVLEGPVPVSFNNGRFGAPRRACPTTELALGGAANLTADVENFYGNIRASGLLTWSFALADDLEAFVELEPVRWQTVISSLDAETLGFGHTSFGATHLLFNDEIAFGLSGRLSLPTATGYYDGNYPLAFDGAALLTTWLHPVLEVHGAVGVVTSAGIGNGPSDPRAGFYLLGGATLRPARWFALVADVDVGFLHDDALDHVAVGGGPRFIIGSFGIDLFLEAPLAGGDRTTVAGLLLLRYDFTTR